ncbi:MAG: hypothetical protein RH948_03060 [Cyclobacteriaceae bacterium]
MANDKDVEESILIPKKLKSKITKAKMLVQKEIKALPIIMDSLDLNFQDLIKMVERLDAKEAVKAFNEIDNKRPETADQVFIILTKNINIEGYDISKFRFVFRKKFNKNKLDEFIKRIKDENLLSSMTVEIARQTAKQILLDNRQKIEIELKNLQD